MTYANIPIFVAHMGCPFQCVYCNQDTITGMVAEPTEDDIRRTIENALETLGQKDEVEIAFFGGSFTMLPFELQARYLSLATEYVTEYGLAGIRLSTRPDGIDWHIIDFLSEYPVRTIELGVQSMDEHVLKASGRGHDIISVLRAVNQIKRYGFRLGLQMMLGLPEDSYDKSIYTAEKLARMRPDFVRIYPTLVLEDTPLEQLYQSGRYQAWDLEEAIETAAGVTGIFMRHAIPIVRMGLYSNEPEFLGKVIAGPYHPAFRELVMSRMMRKRIERSMDLGEKSLVIDVAPQDVSSTIGHKRENATYFRNRYGIVNFQVIADASLKRHTYRYKNTVYSLY